MAVATNKPKAAKPSKPAKNGHSRWTDEQVELLMKTVGATDTHKEAFEEVGRQIGKNPLTVQQKYYSLQRKPITKGKPKARKMVKARAQSRNIQSNIRATNLNSLNDVELVELAKSAAAEIRSRREALEQAEALFSR